MIIIADDLTGANDTAVQYQKYGFSTFVKVAYQDRRKETAPDLRKRYQVLSVNSDSRPMGRRDAYETVRRIAESFCQDEACIYKKIDSLLRGNPDTELEAVMDAGAFHLAFVAPSFPQNGRKVCNGVLRIREQRIDAAELFQRGMKRKTEHVFLGEIRKGTAELFRLVEEKRKEGIEVFVLDAETDEDLSVIAKTAALLPERKILCGSAGLAEQLAAAEAESKSLIKPVFAGIAPEGTRLLAVASRRKETADQVRKAAEVFQIPMVLMDSEAAADGEEERVGRECVSALSAQLAENPPAAIIAVDSLFWGHEMVLRDSAEGYRRGLKIVECLGGIVKTVCETNRIGALLSTGGDISLQICKAFGVHGIELLDEIMPGIPLGKMVGGVADSMVMITKSGAFGGENALVKALRYLDPDEKLAAAE